MRRLGVLANGMQKEARRGQSRGGVFGPNTCAIRMATLARCSSQQRVWRGAQWRIRTEAGPPCDKGRPHLNVGVFRPASQARQQDQHRRVLRQLLQQRGRGGG